MFSVSASDQSKHFKEDTIPWSFGERDVDHWWSFRGKVGLISNPEKKFSIRTQWWMELWKINIKSSDAVAIKLEGRFCLSDIFHLFEFIFSHVKECWTSRRRWLIFSAVCIIFFFWWDSWFSFFFWSTHKVRFSFSCTNLLFYLFLDFFLLFFFFLSKKLVFNREFKFFFLNFNFLINHYYVSGD